MSVMTAAAAAGSMIQGVGGLIAGQQNKKAFRAQAREEERTSQEQERELRKDARRAIGAQLAAQYSNGMLGGSGTAIEAIRESQINAVLDARELRRQSAARAKALRKKGKQAEIEGYFALASGLLGAGAEVKSSEHDWAQARSGSYG